MPLFPLHVGLEEIKSSSEGRTGPHSLAGGPPGGHFWLQQKTEPSCPRGLSLTAASEQTRLSSVHGARCLGIGPFSQTGSVRRQAHDRGTGAVVLVVPRAQELADTCVLHSTQEGVPPARPAHGGPCEAARQLGSSPPSRQKVAPHHQISKRSGFRGLSTSPPVSSFP